MIFNRMENNFCENETNSADVDLGKLVVYNRHPFKPELPANLESINEQIESLTQHHVQLFLSRLQNLPTEVVDDVVVVKLPKPKTTLPRMKPIPKPKRETVWQKFAKAKGIQPKKKTKKIWDEQLKKFIPKYGFKKAASEKQKNWLLEVPANADPYEDQFAKKALAKSENVAKNELKRLRNIAKSKNIKIPRVGITTDHTNISSAKDLQTAVAVAKCSTANLGKFQSKLPKETTAKGVAEITPGASKRKRKLPPLSGTEEKTVNLNIIESVLSKKPKLDIERAVGNQIQAPRFATEEDTNHRKKSSQKRNKTQPIKKSKSAKKPKSQKGQRKVGKKQGGRKRR